MNKTSAPVGSIRQNTVMTIFPQLFSFFFRKYLKMFQLSKPFEKLFPLNLQFAANMAAGGAILF
jgi:hypothetical protein